MSGILITKIRNLYYLEAKAARTKSLRSLHKGTKLGRIYSGKMLASDKGTLVTALTHSVMQLKAAIRTDANRSVSNVICNKYFLEPICCKNSQRNSKKKSQ